MYNVKQFTCYSDDKIVDGLTMDDIVLCST